MKYWVFLIFMVLAAQPVLAQQQQTRYVTDQLEVDLRTGPTLQHRIARFISAGTPLRVVESSDGWARVQLQNGEEGWVLSRYLVNTPSARDQLEQATSSLSQARQETQRLRQQLSSESEKLKTAEAKIAQLTSSSSSMEQRLADAERGLTLFDENRELKKNIVDLRREIQNRDAEIGRLSDRSRQDWFMAGAGVLVLGMVVGIVVPRIRWRKRSSWDRL